MQYKLKSTHIPMKEAYRAMVPSLHAAKLQTDSLSLRSLLSHSPLQSELILQVPSI